jgi:hypothetical protein
MNQLSICERCQRPKTSDPALEWLCADCQAATGKLSLRYDYERGLGAATLYRDAARHHTTDLRQPWIDPDPELA